MLCLRCSRCSGPLPEQSKLLAGEQELNKQICGNCYNHEYDGFVFVDELGERMRANYLTSAFPKFLESHGLRRMRFHDLRHTFATMTLEHGMDVKTLSATIGHVSSATTLDIYSHITDTMQRQAAVHIDRKIGGTDAQMPTIARDERKDTSPVEFTPYKPKIRKPGTGCVTMINDHLYEGRYTPTNAYGKRESHNIYAKTREECEEKLAEMIVQVKAQIKAEKEKMTG